MFNTSRINLYSIYSSREVIEVHTVALRGDVEKVVDWSPEPLRDLSEAREDTLDDEKDEEVGEVVWTSAGSLLRLGQRQHIYQRPWKVNPRSSKG